MDFTPALMKELGHGA
jgi:hypothetical protein